jgi:hypothetical protein
LPGAPPDRVWIDDNDIASKRTCTFLLILSSLAQTGQGLVPPVVTVPSRLMAAKADLE